jgi:hypothetical protein
VDDVLEGLRPSPTNNPDIYEVNTPEELSQTFDELTQGARPVEGGSYPGPQMELPDGTQIGMRPLSDSGGPTIDIDRANGSENIRIHLPRGWTP